ncbi:hypothetical protein [Candidatus Pseudothioglobus sp. Uisw_086]|uniref:prenyltransferase/squalene oxidase repeat-containing protein n=1 Tax=Candidatus Pseudothioglobus sp. Uisw_086 TaxID=3230998 RepID=UPI003A8C41DF
MESQEIYQHDFEKSKKMYDDFIDKCYQPYEGYRLTPKSETSPYALCFAIFGKHLIGKMQSINNEIDFFDSLLRSNIKQYKEKCISLDRDIHSDKGYLQLLCFTLSALSIIDTLQDDSLLEHVLPLIVDKDIMSILESSGTFTGSPGSGNLAMFYATLLIYSRNYLKLNIDESLDNWVETHIASINSNGFWGKSDKNLYLQFQNGYHQYEIFEYLGIKTNKENEVANFVYSLSDKIGHFAPYPGGGGCYDYDAIFALTLLEGSISDNHKALLEKTLNTILTEQNIDGGFSETLYIRPRNIINIKAMYSHIKERPGRLRIERARYCLTLLRPKHNNIKTHWTEYSREWSESNLWDSWFRMLTIARIDKTICLSSSKWGFINFPGIGFRPV